MKSTTLFCLSALLLLALLAGCGPLTLPAAATQAATETPGDAAPLAPQPATEESPQPLYVEFTASPPVQVSFQMPQGWDWWGNAGYLSPDDGQSLAGVRFTFLEEGVDVATRLFNEGAPVLAEDNVLVGPLETHRYTVESILTSASTGEEIFHTYEMVYTFPAPDGELMTGVVVSAQSLEELANLEPVAEHMIESMRWPSAE